MFTGIIKEVGKILKFDRRGDFAQAEIFAPETCRDAALGDSICVNGVCLTANHLTGESFFADLSQETLNRTTFVSAYAGRLVNIEPSLRPHDRMGGHIVSGHVDGVGKIVQMREQSGFTDMTVRFPEILAPYIAQKGSVCVDGISLTVTNVTHDEFGVALVPFTIQHTSLQTAKTGDDVNLEVDMIARYVERLMKYNTSHPAQLTAETLERLGSYNKI